MTRFSSLEWTPAQIAELTRLWGDGLTAAQIGAQFHVSRSAITGKVHRLMLPVRSKAITERAPRSHSPKPPQVAPMPHPETTPAPEATAMPVRLADAESHHCKFPLWGADDGFRTGFPVCGAQKIPGKAFCRNHMRIAYQGLPKRVA